MSGRRLLSAKAKYGFNGKENDKETIGTSQGTQNYGLRIYNPALGKFLSVDPLTKDYPFYTPYQFAGNTPIQAIDLDGGEPKYQTSKYIAAGSDHLYNGHPDYKPKLVLPRAKTLGERIFPDENRNIVGKTSIKTGGYDIAGKVVGKPEILIAGGTNDGTPEAAKTIYHRANDDDFMVVGGGKEFTVKETSPDNEGRTHRVSEVKEKLVVGIISLETKEVFVDNQRESYKYRVGIDLSKGYKIGDKGKESKTGSKVDVGVDLKTDYIDIKEKKK